MRQRRRRSSTPPGSRCGRTVWRPCRCETSPAPSACSRRRSTATSTPRTPSTTPCTPRERRQFVDAQAGMPLPDEPLAALQAVVHYFVEFCAADTARYQLLFQRTIPGFEPSPESFKISQDNLATLGAYLESLGLSDPEALDLFTALGTGPRRPADLQRPRRRSLDPADRRRSRDVLRAHHQEGEPACGRKASTMTTATPIDTIPAITRRRDAGAGGDRVRAPRRPAALAHRRGVVEADRLRRCGTSGRWPATASG